jgi:methionyl-tRNA formyltransferase
VQRAVLAGDEITGATTFLIEEGLDTGPCYGTLTEEIRPTDTSGDLLERLAHAGAGLLVATIDGLEDGALQAVPQPVEGVSLAPKVTVADARVDWTAPALRSLPPGVLDGDLVGTATEAVRLGWVRPEGKGEMAAADWLRGLRVEPGETFA